MTDPPRRCGRGQPQVKVVSVGAAYKLEVDARPGRKFKGRIVRTAKALDVRTRTTPAEAEFDNERSGPPDKPDFALYPGMFGRVTLDLRTVPGALVIPAAALAIESNKPYIYAVRDGKVLRTRVTLGHDDGVWVQVVDTPGIGEGDQLIVGDKAGLADGRAVKVVRKGE
jgi:multidrug efflux pump subunit AcrA (membrane-fusion protein)